MYKIGDVIDARADGSYIYMSTDGIKNLDTKKDLEEAQREDDARINSLTGNRRDNNLPHITKRRPTVTSKSAALRRTPKKTAEKQEYLSDF